MPDNDLPEIFDPSVQSGPDEQVDGLLDQDKLASNWLPDYWRKKQDDEPSE